MSKDFLLQPRKTRNLFGPTSVIASSNNLRQYEFATVQAALARLKVHQECQYVG
jgi:hypothetical protein